MKRPSRKTLRSIVAAALVAPFAVLAPTAVPVASAAPTVVAFDMVNSASQNLNAHTNPFAGAFSSAGDGFEKYQRGVSASIPFGVLDDSFSIFPPDNLGIIGEANTDEFFGVIDTENSDNSGPVTATWEFDISSSPGPLSLSIDMGAMGDFEASDSFSWDYSIDAGPTLNAFASSVDEAGSQAYTMDGGANVPLDDPMSANGTLLNNTLQTLTVPVTGSGSTLTLTLTATFDGGSEAAAFQNIVIEAAGGPSVVAFDMVNSASQNLNAHTNPFAGAFSSAGDGFEKYQRGVSASIPFGVLDDSFSIFPPDNLGIIGEANTDEFFGVIDTENSDNSGPVTATWEFDISSSPGPLSLSIDMGAMGDFEASDSFSWDYSIDAGPTLNAFASSVDEAGSQAYTMDGGANVPLDDPMSANGTLLNNTLQTLTVPVTGSGSTLTLTLTATFDGGSEAAAFQNIVIEAAGGPSVVAFDMVNSASQNLNAHTNPFAGAFSSAGDGFEKYQRGVSASIPFGVLDDSFSIFPPDNLGIIGEANTDEFFGVIDTENSDNSGPVTATWEFDISSSPGPLSLSIDMGAMGDFEASDSFSWDYSIDAGPTLNAFASSVDEAGSQAYTMDGGANVPLDDPMSANGTLLNNTLQTLTVPVTGSGSTLTLTLTATFDGGSEAAAFQNIVIEAGGGGGPVGPPFGVCGDDNETPIHVIQGSGANSPEEGNQHVIEAVVVGDFQDTATELSGFFLQEEDADVDGVGATSEGIFVFDNGFADVDLGDVVRVKGEVDEAFGQTQLESITDLAECADQVGGASAATPTLPVATDLEQYEGMSVDFAQTLYATDNENWHRFGEVTLSVGGVLDNPTNVTTPGPAALALQDLNNRSQVQLDDGSSLTSSNPAFDPPTYISTDGTLRRGDTVDGLSGVLGYAFGAYEVHPTSPVSFTRTNERDPAPDVGGTIQVGAFNVLNYFTTIDGSGSICGPAGDQGCRGADSIEEFQRQRAKIVEAIVKLDAEVLGLMEIENAADNTPEADLVAGLNAAAGAGTYDYIATPGGVGDDAIRVALLYQPAAVTPVGSFAVLDSSVDPLFNDDKNRAVLAQTFEENESGERFTVAVNHLKSKGSACDDVGDPDAGDLQGNCNGVRTDGAIAQANWLATDPTGSGDPDFLITGDLNSYAQEDPIVALENAGYADLIQLFQGVDYSFVFQGQSGYLDHAMSSTSLTAQVTGAAFWHVNADEPRSLDYNLDQNYQASLFQPDEWRASDHDPVLVGLDMVDARGQKEKAASDLAGILPTGNRSNDRRIQQAIDSINASLNPSFWLDDSHLAAAASDDGGRGKKVFDHERAAVKELMRVSGGAAAGAQAAIDRLIDADDRLANAALDIAIATGGDAAQIAKAQSELASAAAEVGAGAYDKAIDHYRKAWQAAIKAVGEARFSTYNASLNRSNAGDLARELAVPGSAQPDVIAEIVQRNRPDVLLINEFDYDASGAAGALFQRNYLSVPHGDAQPIEYPFRYSAPSNTGIFSGFDLDNSGAAGDFAPNDSFGFGFFPGQFGMIVYSMHPIDVSDIRTFQNFLWKDMPGALLPDDPLFPGPADWYSPEELDVFRLSSKSHWDVPVAVGDRDIHFLVSHPTPPVFDGAEDRNGTRNHDEIRFWADYVRPSASGYIYDDNGGTGGLGGGARFVIAGDQNSDPNDGDSIPGAIQQLLDNPKVNTKVTPASPGGPEQAVLQGGINATHISDPAFDTADFSDSAPGNLRVDYVLPSKNLTITDAAVFWPTTGDPLFPLVGTFPFPSSDHKLVWVDVGIDGDDAG